MRAKTATSRAKTIGLCMIVKNESHVILRCLESVRPLIDYVLIEDTGSTDGTQAIIREYLKREGIPGEVIEEPWQDFAYNRSYALAKLRENKDIEYALTIDADDVLVLDEGFDAAQFKQSLSADLYHVLMNCETIRYHLPQLCSNRREFRYRGVKHPFLEQPPGGVSAGTVSGFHIESGRDGGRHLDPDVYRKDALLLEHALETEKDSVLRARYTFYLAQSYRDCGDQEKALENYLARTRLGFWDEEVFQALYNAAKLKEQLQYPFDNILQTYLGAAGLCPWRAEALHGASRLCHDHGRYAEGYAIARQGIDCPCPTGGLFVEPWIHHYGLLDVFAVNAYWAGHYRECLDACGKLLASGMLPEDWRKRVAGNGQSALAKISGEHNTGTAVPLKFRRRLWSYGPEIPGAAFSFLAGLLWLGQLPEARASSLCPASVAQPVVIAAKAGTCAVGSTGPGIPGTRVCSVPGVCPFNPLLGEFVVSSCTPATPAHTVTAPATGFTLKNGQCTNLGAGLDPSAFSGAALASQALSELTQTTTQETSRTTQKNVADRREQEEQRCAEGFSRVDGTCEPNPRPVREEEATVEPEPGPPPSHKLKKAKKPKGAAIQPHEAVPARKIVRHEPLVRTPPPLPVEPALRFATWGQVYGDYERRNASGPAFVTPDPGVGPPVPVGTSVQSRTGTVGFQAGGDLTSRGVLFANDGLIAGAFTGYVRSDLTLNSASLSTNLAILGNGSSHTTANLAGPMAGLYATYFDGGFSTDVLLKVDVLRLNETFSDNLAFTSAGFAPNGNFFPAFNFLFGNSGSTNLLNATVMGGLNYRFNIYPNFWIEPTVGAQYTNTSYGSNANLLGLADGNLVMVQGGARFGTNFLLCGWVRTTAILTGLAYDDVLVQGGFIPGAGFAGNNILAHADQGQLRGRGVLAFNFDFGQGVSSFVQGEARGGQGLFGAGGKAGVRYQW